MFNFTDKKTYQMIGVVLKVVVYVLIQGLFKWILMQLEQF